MNFKKTTTIAALVILLLAGFTLLLDYPPLSAKVIEIESTGDVPIRIDVDELERTDTIIRRYTAIESKCDKILDELGELYVDTLYKTSWTQDSTEYHTALRKK